ncbi:recombinase family protein, partial [Bulleidia sp. HCP3S3_G12]
MCAYSVFNTFPVYPLSAKPLILLAFCRYRYHTSLFDRPDFQRMIDDIEDGKINCVVTKDLSRLGRNYILTGQYTEIYFPSKGVRYIAVNDNVDTINGENELAPFLNILNEMHARQTSKKVKAAMRTRFANG